MTTEHEKRSSPERAAASMDPSTTPGGRQPGPAYSPGGGGSLQNCTIFGDTLLRADAPDPRVQELHAIGLNAQWLTIVEALGFEDFILLWGLLSEMARKKNPHDNDPIIRFRLPKFSRYLRYQRNLLIERLHLEEKLSAKQIYKMLPNSDKVGILHICRVIRRANKKGGEMTDMRANGVKPIQQLNVARYTFPEFTWSVDRDGRVISAGGQLVFDLNTDASATSAQIALSAKGWKFEPITRNQEKCFKAVRKGTLSFERPSLPVLISECVDHEQQKQNS